MKRGRWEKAGGEACVTMPPNSVAQLYHTAIRSNTAARSLTVRPTSIKPAPWWDGPSALFGRLMRDGGESQRLVDQGTPLADGPRPDIPGALFIPLMACVAERRGSFPLPRTSRGLGSPGGLLWADAPLRRLAPGHSGRFLHPPHGLCRGAPAARCGPCHLPRVPQGFDSPGGLPRAEAPLRPLVSPRGGARNSVPRRRRDGLRNGSSAAWPSV